MDSPNVDRSTCRGAIAAYGIVHVSTPEKIMTRFMFATIKFRVPPSIVRRKVKWRPLDDVL